MGSFCLTKVAQNVRPFSGHKHGPKRPKNTAIPWQTRKAATNQRPDSDHESGAMCSHKKSRSRSKKTSTPGRPPHQTKLTNRNSGNPHTVVLEKDPLNRPPQNTFPATTLLNTYSLEPWSSHAQRQQTITRENTEQATPLTSRGVLLHIVLIVRRVDRHGHRNWRRGASTLGHQVHLGRAHGVATSSAGVGERRRRHYLCLPSRCSSVRSGVAPRRDPERDPKYLLSSAPQCATCGRCVSTTGPSVPTASLLIQT